MIFMKEKTGLMLYVKSMDMSFKKSVDLDIGLKYNAINSKQIDVMNVFHNRWTTSRFRCCCC